MAREQRLVFGEDPGLYDRARPSYPDEMIDDVTGLVGADGRVADIGCGTGKATVALAARVPTGVGVEADRHMAAIAARNLREYPGWRVAVSEFEHWGPDAVRFNLLTCAQAWHWLTPGAREAKAAATLEEGGWLALWWNRTGAVSTELRAELDEAYSRLAPELPRSMYGPSDRPQTGPLPGFGSPEHREYAWDRRYTTAEWVELARSFSDHRMLTEDRLDALLRAVAGVIDRHGGVFDHPYCTSLWTAQRV